MVITLPCFVNFGETHTAIASIEYSVYNGTTRVLGPLTVTTPTQVVSGASTPTGIYVVPVPNLNTAWDALIVFDGGTGQYPALSTGPSFLHSGGLDAVVVEAGINIRQAMSPILGMACGAVTGASGTTVVVAAAGFPGTARVTATVDNFGNRSGVVLNLPA